MKTLKVKQQFIKKNFCVLFCAFVLPTLVSGAIVIYSSYSKTTKEVDRHLDNTLNLVVDNLNDLAGMSKSLNAYVESNHLTSSLSKLMNSKNLSYNDRNSILYFSSFITTLSNFNSLSDSIYIYLSNDINRVYTSSRGFVFLNSLSDQEWISLLMENDAHQWISTRSKTDYSFENPKPILSVFSKFHSFSGGTVINYSLNHIQSLYESTMFYSDQIVLLTDYNDNLLMTAPASCENSSDWAAQITSGQIGEKYLYRFCNYPEYQIRLYTLVPKSTLFHEVINATKTITLILVTIIIVTILLAYYLSLNSYNQLNQVINLFDCADKGETLPSPPGNKKDIYSQILENVIRLFLQNNYLKIQLSERKYRLQTAQLQALQYQINPHFLYNTLQAINYEILTLSNGVQTNANLMLEDLADIMRYSLSTGEHLVMLSAELENCKKYINIQRNRYENPIPVTWKIDNSLNTALIIPLILQPLIENAITHGIKSKPDNGQIWISIELIGSNIRFRVFDNGIGIDAAQLTKLNESLRTDHIEYTSSHIGLPNCNQRLILYYGKDSALRIQSKPGVGTLVSFIIPSCPGDGFPSTLMPG